MGISHFDFQTFVSLLPLPLHTSIQSWFSSRPCIDHVSLQAYWKYTYEYKTLSTFKESLITHYIVYVSLLVCLATFIKCLVWARRCTKFFIQSHFVIPTALCGQMTSPILQIRRLKYEYCFVGPSKSESLVLCSGNWRRKLEIGELHVHIGQGRALKDLFKA